MPAAPDAESRRARKPAAIPALPKKPRSKLAPAQSSVSIVQKGSARPPRDPFVLRADAPPALPPESQSPRKSAAPQSKAPASRDSARSPLAAPAAEIEMIRPGFRAARQRYSVHTA